MTSIYKKLAITLTAALVISAAAPAVPATNQPGSVAIAKTKKKKTKVKKSNIKYVNRITAIKEIWKMAGSPALTGSTGFTDVKKSASYAKAVRFAVRTAVVKGGGKLKPSAKLTRQVLAGWLWNYSGCPTADTKWKDDKKVSKDLREASGWAKSTGIFSSVAGKKFDPTAKVTKKDLEEILEAYMKGPGKEAVLVGGLPADCGASGIIFDKEGYLYVTDSFSHKIHKLGDGASEVVAGADTVLDINDQPLGGYNDGPYDKAFFNKPWAITPFLGGYAITDSENGAVRLLATDGSVKTINGSSKEGLPHNKNGVVYGFPTGITTDDEGNIYIADTEAGAIRKMTTTGDVITVARDLYDPTGLCYHDGYVYVAESSYNRISRVDLTNTDGAFEVLTGTSNGDDGLVDGKLVKARFTSPQGVLVADDGTIYVADTINGAIRRIRGNRVTTLLVPKSGLPDTWPASPTGLALLGNRLYIADPFAKKVYIINV